MSCSPQKCKLQSFVVQKVPIWQRLLTNQLEGFEYNFKCLKWFFRNLPRKLRSACFLKSTLLKIRLLVTWLKCLRKRWWYGCGNPRLQCPIVEPKGKKIDSGRSRSLENAFLRVRFAFIHLCKYSWY